MRHLVLAVFISAPAFAQVFSWEDKDGVHYTNDAASVPKGAKVKKLETDDRPSSAQPAPQVEVAAAPAPSAAPPSPANPSVEREWRDRFIALNRAIATKKQELNALEVSLPNKVDCVPQQRAVQPAPGTAAQPFAATTTRCVPNSMYDRIKLQIEQKRVEVKDAENDLEQLDRRASFEGVPREWRRGW
ncbi:MAG: DUF4124 domain-containing protein [Archangiaceae bacterium]|nr:DUF4124 domain-containing protein [Archangiaceae bacterium]